MCDFSGDNKSCKCRMAVLKTYHEMTGEHELPNTFALQAAYRVYRFHHPEDTKETARLKVESWIHEGHFH